MLSNLAFNDNVRRYDVVSDVSFHPLHPQLAAAW
jgi:hypothetical protein